MDEQKRLFLFVVLSTMFLLLMTQVMRTLWPPPQRRPPAVKKAVAQSKQAPKQAAGKKTTRKPAATGEQKEPKRQRLAELHQPPLEERTMGSTDPQSGFKIKAIITNRGASVRQIELAEYDSADRSSPLRLVSAPPLETGSFAFRLTGVYPRLDHINWRFLDAKSTRDGEQIVKLEAPLPQSDLKVVRTYRLAPNSYHLTMEIAIANRGSEPTEFSYRLYGPRGFVLEGEWYARKFRDVALAGGMDNDVSRTTIRAAKLAKAYDKLSKKYSPLLHSQSFVLKGQWQEAPELFDEFDADHDGRLRFGELDRALRKAAGSSYRWATEPLRFAAVESQYFCAAVLVPRPASRDARWDRATYPLLVQRHRTPARSETSFEIQTRKFALLPGEELKHVYLIYAGPRKREIVLVEVPEPAVAHALLYSRGWFLFLPGSLVNATASLMLFCLKLFHSVVRNWGVAIILLTVVIRLLMFPVSRKQALSAQKMQALKPELEALRQKYKNDKQKLAQAQMELWRKHGVNPLGGCLPVLIQMPVFIGLWQALATSVDLRHAPFMLWINDLSAPDALFRWGDNIPIISWVLGPYFNLLPTILIVLMVIQQKVFMPPATDPQTETQQRIMTWTMIFFGAIFYRLPSGLCLYYTVSTLWGLAERALLPKFEPSSDTGAEKKEPAKLLLRGKLGRERQQAEKRVKTERIRATKGARRRAGRTAKVDHKKPAWVRKIEEIIKMAGKP